MNQPATPNTFREFYNGTYRDEHHHPANVALHLAGTLLGLGLLGTVAGSMISAWWVLTFPVVHAAPGLLGHLLFERNTDVGHARVGRRDYPLIWFIAANHILAWRLLTLRRP